MKRSGQKILKQPSIIPGFNLSLGMSMSYLTLIVLIPISALFIEATELSWYKLVNIYSDPRTLKSFELSLACSLIAAAVSAIVGTLVAWVLVRYKFPGSEILDAIIDLPFAIPTAVAGIALTAIYAPSGIIGKLFIKFGIKIAFTPIGIIIALIFVGLPFVVRTVEPVIQNLQNDVEEAAATLGASPFIIFYKVILPSIMPSVITGFALALSRALGEYGSVIFIAGNIPKVSEIVPLLIVTKMEEFDFLAATAIAGLMLVISFTLLLLINVVKHTYKRG